MKKRIYGNWAGNPKGVSENITCCIEEIWSADRWAIGRQCCRKRGYGPNGLFCKQHGRRAEKNLAERGKEWFENEYSTPLPEKAVME